VGKYLFQSSYTLEGVKGLAKEGGSSRRKTVEAAVEKIGGKLEAFYYAFGDVDVYLIVDLPDHVAATALALAVNQAGAATIKTTVLITPEEVDKAVKQKVTYRPPGAKS
jgi:uncharacterized protein with GYD domain